MALVSISEDETLRYWNSNDVGPALTEHSSSVNCIVVTESSQCDYRPENILVTGSDDTTIRCWKTDGSQLGPTLEGHKKPVTQIAVLPNRAIVSGSSDHTVRVWKKDGTSVLLRGPHAPTPLITLTPSRPSYDDHS